MCSPAHTSPRSPPQAGEVSGAGGGLPRGFTDRGGEKPRTPSLLRSAPQETGSAFVLSPPRSRHVTHSSHNKTLPAALRLGLCCAV